jgi:imidazolonepropionase-like amidohydrolase
VRLLQGFLTEFRELFKSIIEKSSISNPKKDIFISMSIAIRVKRLYPNASTGIIQDGVVVVEGTQILQVGSWKLIGPSLGTSIPQKNLGEVTLMPGLFDCHVRMLFYRRE